MSIENTKSSSMLYFNELSQMLRSSSLFGELSNSILNDLIKHLKVETITSGTQLFYEGKPSDKLLIVISGRLRASHKEENGTLRLYNEIEAGESVGEIGLILGQPRSADVTAIRDSNVAILERKDYEKLLLKYPLDLNRIFTKIIFNHLSGVKKQKSQKTSFIISVVPLSNYPTNKLMASLEKFFSKIGKTISLDREYAKKIRINPEEKHKAVKELSKLEKLYKYILCEAEYGDSLWTGFTMRQADHVLFVASKDDNPLSNELKDWKLELLNEDNYEIVRKSLAIIHDKSESTPIDLSHWREEYKNLKIVQIRRDFSSDITRLSRFLINASVGLVLGGGGARGFAHIGVIRALEEAGVEIDFVGGNSMGALIGAQYVNGKPLDEILKDTLKFTTGGELPTLPIISLVLGRRIEKDLKKMFGSSSVDMSWKPFFTVACNLTTAKLSVLEDGPLWKAVLASNSPAGLLPPVVKDGELLVDGAILNNVPADIMRSKIGSGKLIAVDVDVREGPIVDKKLNRLSVSNYFLKKFRGQDENKNPNVTDILTRAGHIGALINMDEKIALSDYYLQPPVSNFSLIGYKRAHEIAEVGYEYTKEILKVNNQFNSYTPS